MVKVASLDVQLVTNTGNQAVAHKDTIVQSIIQGDSRADVQSVAQPGTIFLNAHVQRGLMLRMPSGMRPHGIKMTSTGKILNGSLRSMRRPRERKVKEKGPSLKENLSARVHRDRLHPDQHSLNLLESRGDRSRPKAKPEARSCMTWCLRSPSRHGDVLVGMVQTTWFALWLNHRRSCHVQTRQMVIASRQQNLPLWTWCQEYEEHHSALRRGWAMW